jgi:hypothetical protein
MKSHDRNVRRLRVTAPTTPIAYTPRVLGFVPSGETHRIRDSGGEALLWLPAPRTVACSFSGHISAGIVCSIYAKIDAYTARHEQPIHGFVDFGDASGFDSEARSVSLRWNVANRKADSQMHLFVDSLVARLGVRILSLALGDVVRVYPDRASFASAYALTKRRNEARVHAG